MARFEPQSNDLTSPFWEASKEERYLVQWCGSCNSAIYYPREVCPSCLVSDHLEWKESPGNGEVYTFNVMHKPGLPFMTDRLPFVIALVTLDEGIRVVTNIVNCEPSTVSVGMPVKLAWEDLSDGRKIPVFEPA